MATTLAWAFADVLKELRAERGISQEALSHGGGGDRTYVSRLENAQNSPTMRALWRISEVLEIAPSEILRRVEERLDPADRAF